jgi:hypothetical protein
MSEDWDDFGYFGKKAVDAGKRYRTFVEEMIGTEYDSPLQNTFGSAVLGSGEFVEKVTKTMMSEAKSIICYLAVRRMGYSGETVAKALGITRSGVCRGASRGAAYVAENPKWSCIGELINKSTTSPKPPHAKTHLSDQTVNRWSSRFDWTVIPVLSGQGFRF